MERCQSGFGSYEYAPWNDVSRGMTRPNPEPFDEMQIRVFWREWDRYITGTVHDPEVLQNERAGRVALPYPKPGITVGADR